MWSDGWLSYGRRPRTDEIRGRPRQVNARKGRLFAIALLAIAAFLLLWSLGAPWGASSISGQRYQLRLWGLSADDDRHGFPPTLHSCHWFDRSSFLDICAAAEDAGPRFVLLKLALPLMLLALSALLSAGALIAVGVIGPFSYERSALPLLLLATFCCFGVIFLVTSNAQSALRVLQTNVVSFEGTGLAAANAGMVALSLALLVSRSFRRRTP